MAGPADGGSTIRFSIFELDLKAGELRRNGSKVRLQEQPFQILVSLLEQPGQVVSRDELRSKLWPADTFVDFDHSLNAAIRRLRDALGDSADFPRFVETVARRGYRFIAPVAGTTIFAAGSEATVEPVPAKTQIPVVQQTAAARRLRRRGKVAVIALVLISCGITGVILIRRSTKPPEILQRRLTANRSEVPVIGAALSPSGKYLAFSDPTGAYLRQVDSGETHPLPMPAGFVATPWSWFPDDAHLLVTHPSGNGVSGLWKISVLGGDPVRLTDNGSAAVASPNGSQIAFLRATHSTQEIWLMSASGENPTKISACELCLLGGFAWSPDSKRLAYVRQQYEMGSFWGFDTQLEVFSLDDHRSNVLERHVGPALAWIRDGRIVYILEELPPNQTDANLWARKVNTRTMRFDGTPVQITNGNGLIASVSASADGTKLAIVRRTLQPNVYVANVENGGSRISTPQVLTADEWYDLPTAWTPDSKAVLFFSDRDGVFHIFKQRIDKAEPDLLVGGNEPAVLPRLSPDGSMVLYLKSAQENQLSYVKGPHGDSLVGPQQIMRVSVGGGPPEPVLAGTGINNLQCARLPSTLCLYSELRPGEEHFYSFDPLNGKGQELSSLTIHDNDYYSFNWSLSPDGKLLAFAKFNWNLSPDGKLLAFAKKLGIQDRPAIRLLSLPDYKEHPIPLPGWTGLATLDWSADGKSLWATAFTTSESTSGLWTTGLNATSKWTLLNIDLSGKVFPALQESKMNLGWAIPSPDGTKIALWEASGGSNVWLVEIRQHLGGSDWRTWKHDRTSPSSNKNLNARAVDVNSISGSLRFCFQSTLTRAGFVDSQRPIPQ